MIITLMLHLLSLLSLLSLDVNAFEVPFPSSASEIRSSVVVSSPIADPSGLPLPVTQQLPLGSGTKAEVISCLPPPKPTGGGDDDDLFSALFGSLLSTENKKEKSKKYDKPVLAFLHGSFHASWCWSEKYMPYFASLGYPCVALSLQGTGGTPVVEEGAKKVKIASHVADLDAFLRGLSDGDHDDNTLGLELGYDPQIALIGHSFGGLTIMKWLEQYYGEDNNNNNNNNDDTIDRRRNINLAGVALACSVPPSGNGPMTMRFLRRSIRDSWKITAGFVLKRAIADKSNCRDLFFGGTTEDDDNGISDEDVERYQGYFERDTVATIDLGDLAKRLPSAKADVRSGKAPFCDRLPSKSLVIAARGDFVVDEEGSRESAAYLNLESPVFVDSPHDVMLGKKWKNGADAILEWVQSW